MHLLWLYYTAIVKERTSALIYCVAIAELTIKLNDTESFVDEIAEVAYMQAVEAVTDKVQEEVRNEDFEIIADEKNVILHGYIFAPDTVRVIDGVFAEIMDRFKGMTRHISDRLAAMFRTPETKNEIKEPIKESIRARLARGKIEADAYNAARKNCKPPKKRQQNMER